jgi:hypothetical protein
MYRPSNRRLLAKLVPTFLVRGCHVVSVTDPYGRIFGFLEFNFGSCLPSINTALLETQIKFYRLICGLFNNSVSNSRYESAEWKDEDESDRMRKIIAHFEILFRHFTRAAEENSEHISQDSQSPS